VVSRVDFVYANQEQIEQLRRDAREQAPWVYRSIPSSLDALERTLMSLPEDVSRLSPEQFPKELKELRLDSGTITDLKQIQAEKKDEYKEWARSYMAQLREAREQGRLVVIDREEWLKDARATGRPLVKLYSSTPGADAMLLDKTRTYFPPGGAGTATAPEVQHIAEGQRAALLDIVNPLAAKSFVSPLAANIARITVDTLKPTHALDRDLTAKAQNDAAMSAPLGSAQKPFRKDEAILVEKGDYVTSANWRLLNEEQRAFVAQTTWQQRLASHGGMAGLALLITAAISVYAALYQPRITRNSLRAVALGGLLLAMLLLAQVAALSTAPLLLFGVAPTLLVAMVLAIAYDQRFGMGIGSLHGILVTAVLDQGVGFFLIIWLGVMTACLLLDDVRSRSKLIEVGGISAVVMMAAAAAVVLSGQEPLGISWDRDGLIALGRQCLYTGAAGMGVGFVVLGILQPIERTFKITTSMTLLEYADGSQPLLKRLAMDAPGTYMHSLQVAALAEAAAEAIGANSLLCRVGSYYHDVGKVNKPDYFCENQVDGRNRHLNLSPNVSLLIIIGHVKDGVEMAKEYNLPGVILPIIHQHHGTTLVEYFYHRAKQQTAGDEDEQPVSDTQYRYPGPKPKSREAAIVMIADASESATRAMGEPTHNRIEGLVHDIVMNRLNDGQFDESDLTFQELALVEKTIVKTLVGIYHGRLAYPSKPSAAPSSGGITKTA
jgi:putative nucleotidyltransferase with HDIG domain